MSTMNREVPMLTAAVGGVFSLAATTYMYVARPKQARPESRLQRRLIVTEPNPDVSKVRIAVEKVPIPTPKPGQVLVKMAAVPLHPSVVNVWKSKSAKGRPFGNEGSGVVVGSGGGVAAGLLMGRKVGIVTTGRDEEATAAEYICVDASRCAWSFPDSVDLLDMSTWFVNPVTVLSILAITRDNKSTALLHTGASSQLGQMLVRLAPEKGITILNVVRRKEQVKMLSELGAKHIVCQADEDWLDQLEEKIKELKVKVAFDAVAGDMTGQVLSKLPIGGSCYVYGVLSGDPVGHIDPLDLIYRDKKVKGHIVFRSWLQKARGGPLGILLRFRSCINQVAPGLKPGGWASSQYQDCSMEDTEKEFASICSTGFTGRKLRIRMDL